MIIAVPPLAFFAIVLLQWLCVNKRIIVLQGRHLIIVHRISYRALFMAIFLIQGMKSQVDGSKKVKAKNRPKEKVFELCHTLPVSYCVPGTGNIIPMDNKKAMKRQYRELMELQSEPRPLTMVDRKKGYIEETRVRYSNRRKEEFYYHVKTNQEFQSLKEVGHEYIKFGNEQRVDYEKIDCSGDQYP